MEERSRWHELSGTMSTKYQKLSFAVFIANTGATRMGWTNFVKKVTCYMCTGAHCHKRLVRKDGSITWSKRSEQYVLLAYPCLQPGRNVPVWEFIRHLHDLLSHQSLQDHSVQSSAAHFIQFTPTNVKPNFRENSAGLNDRRSTNSSPPTSSFLRSKGVGSRNRRKR